MFSFVEVSTINTLMSVRPLEHRIPHVNRRETLFQSTILPACHTRSQLFGREYLLCTKNHVSRFIRVILKAVSKRSYT